MKLYLEVLSAPMTVDFCWDKIITSYISTLKYNGTAIDNVYVLGYGYVSSFTTLFSNYSPTSYSRNIYYDIQ